MITSTRRYYESHAAQYFQQTYGKTLANYWLMVERRVAPGRLILDLGCGSGRDLRHFSDAGYLVIGLDYALPLLRMAVVHSQQQVVLGDLRALPFSHGSFDVAWAMASLLHLPRESIEATIRGVRFCVKTHGTFFAAVKKGYGEEVDGLGRYNVFYSTDEWVTIVERSGFDVVDLQQTIETRESIQRHRQEIPWIATLARAAK